MSGTRTQQAQFDAFAERQRLAVKDKDAKVEAMLQTHGLSAHDLEEWIMRRIKDRILSELTWYR